MATYLQGVTPYIPQIQPFQEDFNFYANVLQQRQTAYDSNFKALNDIYGQYFYADMLREDNLERKAELIKTIDNNLRKASGTDLSLQQNVQAAKQIFKPFYEDKALMKDIAFTKSYKNQLSKAESLKNCVGSDCPEGYWDGGVRLLHYQAEDFRKASAEKALNFQNPTYTSYVNVMKEANAAVKAAGFKITYEGSNGKYIVKTENGDQAIAPLNDFLLQNFGNDPRFIDFYKAQADLTLRENPEAAIDIYEQQMLRRQAKSPEEYQRLVQEKAQEKALIRSKTYINETAQETRKISQDAEMFAYSWDEYAKANGGLLAPDAKLAEEAKNEAQVTKQTYEQVAALADSVNGVKYYDANGQRVSDETLKQTIASALMYSDIANTATTIARATASQTVKGADPYAIAKYRSDLSMRNYTQKKIIDIVSTIDPLTGGLIDNESNRNKWEDQYNKNKAGKNITHTSEEKEDLYQDWLQKQGQERLQSLETLRNIESGNVGGITEKKAESVNKVIQESPNPTEEVKVRPTSVNVDPVPSTTQKDEKQKPANLPSVLKKPMFAQFAKEAETKINESSDTRFEVVYDETAQDKGKFGLKFFAETLMNGQFDGKEFGNADAKAAFSAIQSSQIQAFNRFKDLSTGASKSYNAERLIPTFKNKITSSDFQNTAKLIYSDIKKVFKGEIDFPENINDITFNDITQKLNEANESNPVKLFKAFTSSSRVLSEPDVVKEELMTEFKSTLTKSPGKAISNVLQGVEKATTYNLAKEVKLKALGIDNVNEFTFLETIITQDKALQEAKSEYMKSNTKAIDLMIQEKVPALQSNVEEGRNFSKFTATKYSWNPNENNGMGGLSDLSYMFNKLLQNDIPLLKKAINISYLRQSYTPPAFLDKMSTPNSTMPFLKYASALNELKAKNITLDNESLKSLLINFGSYNNSSFNKDDIETVNIKGNNLIINNKASIPLESIILPDLAYLLDFIPSEKDIKDATISIFETLESRGSKGNIPGMGSLFTGTQESDWSVAVPSMHVNLSANTLENDKTVYDMILKGVSQAAGQFKQPLKNFAGTDIPRATTESGSALTQEQLTLYENVLQQNWSKGKDLNQIPKLDIYVEPFSEHGLNISKVMISINGGAEGLRDKLSVTTNADVANKSQKKDKPLRYIPETIVLYVDTDEIEEYNNLNRNIAWNTIKPGTKFGEDDDPAQIEILKQTSDVIDYKINLRTFNPETERFEKQSWEDKISSGTTSNIHHFFINQVALQTYLVNEHNQSNK